MAIIRKKQMKEMTAADAKKRLLEMRLDLAKDRAQIAIGGSSPNPGKTREKRRTIAKLLTLMNNIRRAKTPQASAAKNVKTARSPTNEKKKGVGKTA